MDSKKLHSRRFIEERECKKLPNAGGDVKWFDYEMVGGCDIFTEQGRFKAENWANHCTCRPPHRKLTYKISICDLSTRKIIVSRGGKPSLEQAARAAEEDPRNLL